MLHGNQLAMSMSDYMYGDYLDTLGIDNYYTKKPVSRQRGPNPTPSEAETRAIDNLSNKLISKAPKSSTKGKDAVSADGEVEEALTFDITSTPRVILYEGKVQKRTQNSMLIGASRRHLFLLNDVLLVTASHITGSFKSVEKHTIHQIIPLDKLSLALHSREESPLVFELQAPDRSYSFVCDREEDKRIWVEELSAAMLSIHFDTRYARYPGWQHEVLTGTLHSAALLGDVDMLQVQIQSYLSEQQSLDQFDDTGMTPLHWAALRGHKECVSLLLKMGANGLSRLEHDVDVLNSGLNSALLLAASRGHDDILRMLLDSGADVRLRNLKDRDALFMSVLYAHSTKGLPSILNTLNFQGVNLDQLDSTGAAPLHECAARNLARPVQLLVAAGALVNTKHGRSGITPLQIACSAKFPDAETVRSFLDNGAFPNWKDAESRTPLEVVLFTHELHSKTLDQYPDDNEQLSPLEYFVQSALPVLMEIVKKGGRYTEASISKLRPSFKEAIDTARQAWNTAREPECFPAYVYAKDLLANRPQWTSDTASGYCLLCVDKFTYSSRRHHCRSCGILCCAVCSSKRLPLVVSAPTAATSGAASGTSSPTVASPNADRVCDGCFNRLTYEASVWAQRQSKAKKELERQEAEAAAQLANARITSGSSSPVPPAAPNSSSSLTASKAALFGSSSSSSAAAASTLPTPPSTGATMGVMNETRAVLEANAETLKQINVKGEALREGASEFSRMARQLKKQQEERNNWLGGSKSK